MESLNPSKVLYDEVRGQLVAATPEELVRQHVIATLCHLGFPKQLMVVEKTLKQMPHIHLDKRSKLPLRRADLVCFTKASSASNSLVPLLLVECKAEALNEGAMRQLVGYNYYLGASFIALANAVEVRLSWYDSLAKCYRFLDHFPSFEKLGQRRSLVMIPVAP